VFRHVLAGAGGWGDPLERDAAAVLRDVKNELLSSAKAAADYGVVVADGAVNAAATTKRRTEMRAARAWRDAPKVQWHDPKTGTDHVFPGATAALNALIK
jgi:N-methylhydantoinase B